MTWTDRTSPNVVLMGPPGSGKGTQAARLSACTGLEHLSTGEVLRAGIASGSAVGSQVRRAVETGSLVPDDLVTDMVLARLRTSRAGYLLDGYPRSEVQAKALLDSPFPPDRVLVLDVPAYELTVRLLARSRMQGRADDTIEVIEHRLSVYRESSLPVVRLFDELGLATHIDADRDADAVAATVLAVVRGR